MGWDWWGMRGEGLGEWKGGPHASGTTFFYPFDLSREHFGTGTHALYLQEHFL